MLTLFQVSNKKNSRKLSCVLLKKDGRIHVPASAWKWKVSRIKNTLWFDFVLGSFQAIVLAIKVTFKQSKLTIDCSPL